MEAKSYSKRDVSRVLRTVAKPDNSAKNRMLSQAEKKKRLAEFDLHAQKLVEKLLDIFVGE